MGYDEEYIIASPTKEELIMSELDRKVNKTYAEMPKSEIAMIPDDLTAAKWQYDCICKQIKEFENSLDSEHEIALLLTNFGQSILLNVTKIDYQNPSLIYYYGMSKYGFCQLIQHISQINFLLTAVEKQIPSRPARRIGFGD